jgi:hypothetical protein
MQVKRTLIAEFKTTSQDISPGSPYWRRLDIDEQCSTYIGLSDYFKIESPEGILYDVAKKPGIRPLKASAKKKAETPDEYEQRCLDEIAENPEAFYQRGYVVRINDELANAARDMWQTVMFIEFAKQTNSFPRNPGGCDKWGRICDFFDVCTGKASLDDKTRFTPPDPAKKRLPLASVSASSLANFRLCPRLYQYQSVLGYKLAQKPYALAFGIAWHRGLEVWWKTLDLQLALAEFDPLPEAKLAAMDPKDRPPPIEPFDRAKLRAMLRGYDAQWREEPYDVLLVEEAFVAPLRNPDTGEIATKYEVRGRVDAVVQEVVIERKEQAAE